MPEPSDVHCRLELNGAVGWIWLDDYGRRNALSVDLVSQLRDRFDEAASRARTIVIANSGPHFSSGGDHVELDGMSKPELLDFSSQLMGLFAAISGSPVPVVVAARGGAVGGGLELMLCADFIVVDESAFVQVPQVTLGISVGDYLVANLINRCGTGTTRRMVLTGQTLAAAEAAAAGVVDEVATPAELLSRAGQLANQLATLPPRGLERSRRLISEHIGSASMLRATERKLHERFLGTNNQ